MSNKVEDKLKKAIAKIEYAIIGFNEIKDYVERDLTGDAESWLEHYAESLQKSLDEIKAG